MATADELARMSPTQRQDMFRKRYVTLKGVHQLPTVRIVREDGHEVTINKTDYDPAIHTLAGEDASTKAAPETETPAGAGAGDDPRAELEAMTIGELKLLPEWEGVEGRSRLKTKEDIVDALLNVM